MKFGDRVGHCFYPPNSQMVRCCWWISQKNSTLKKAN